MGNIWVKSEMVSQRVRGHSLSLMERSMKESGKMGMNMDKELTLLLMG